MLEILTNNIFSWAQLKHATPARWKELIIKYSDVKENNVYQNHHVIKQTNILPLKKLSSKKIYTLFLISNAFFQLSLSAV